MRNFNNTYKLFAGFLALVLVAGMTSPAFAGGIPECIIEPASANVEISEKGGSDIVEKKITCPVPLDNVLNVYEETCANYSVALSIPNFDGNMITFAELLTNSEGPFVTEHCEVTFQIMSLDGSYEYLTQELWFNMPEDKLIGGTVGSMSTTSLLVAGAQANMGLWSLALVGMVGAAAAITYKVKSKKTEQ